MVEFLRYLFRLAAAVLLAFVALTLAVLMLSGKHIWPLALSSVVMIGAAWAMWPRRPNSWRSDPPSQKQLEYAADLGIHVPRGATKGQVSDIISQVAGR